MLVVLAQACVSWPIRAIGVGGVRTEEEYSDAALVCKPIPLNQVVILTSFNTGTEQQSEGDTIHYIYTHTHTQYTVKQNI